MIAPTSDGCHLRVVWVPWMGLTFNANHGERTSHGLEHVRGTLYLTFCVCDPDMKFIYVLSGEGSALIVMFFVIPLAVREGCESPELRMTQSGESGTAGGRSGTSRRVLMHNEESTLINALKDIVVAGMCSEQGFKPGHLSMLECFLLASLPGTDLRARPHIESKLGTWR